MFDGFDVVELAADPPGWREEIDAWGAAYGADRVVEFLTSRPSEMGPAIDRFLEALDRGSFTHDGTPELREYALNAVLTKAKGRTDQPALAKPTVDDKIDGLVAAVLGYAELAHFEEGDAPLVFAY
jgi:phage terminase large subunit-like protein